MTQTRRGYRLTGEPVRARGDVFDVYVFGMSHVGENTYWHLSLVGRTHTQTLTIKTATRIASLTPPADLLEAVYTWLRTGVPQDHAFVEMVSA